MTQLIPERVNRAWMDLLDNIQLADAESTLHADFLRQDSAEKTRRGGRYRLLEGPSSLIEAWNRWSLVNNEARHRGIPTRQRA
jgi:hypothetical protein